MSTVIETVPTTWSTDDETFFRIVAQVLPCAFTEGAGCLLASYDDEAAPVRRPTRVAAPRTAAPASTAAAVTA